MESALLVRWPSCTRTCWGSRKRKVLQNGWRLTHLPAALAQSGGQRNRPLSAVQPPLDAQRLRWRWTAS